MKKIITLVSLLALAGTTSGCEIKPGNIFYVTPEQHAKAMADLDQKIAEDNRIETERKARSFTCTSVVFGDTTRTTCN
jgi:hypothetical protein